MEKTRFHYKAYDESGTPREGDIAADSRGAAAEVLLAASLHPIRIAKTGSRSRKRARSLSRETLSLFAGEWAALLEAGLTLTGSLTLLEGQAGRKERKTLEAMGKAISSGKGVWESLEADGRFPPFFMSLVKVGEMTGTLPRELRRLSAYYKKEEELVEKMKGALAYPLFVIFFALAVLCLILTCILPSFAMLFSALSIGLPPLSQKALALGLFLQEWGIVLFPGLALAVMGAVLYGKSGTGRARTVHFLYGRTWYKRILLIRFCYALSAFLESGKPLTASLEEVKAVLSEEDTDRAISYMVSAIARGEPFARAARESGFCLPAAEGLIQVGMESGELPFFLSQAAELLTVETERSFRRFRALLEPCLLLFTGALTAFILFSVMLPVFNAAGQAFMK